MIIAEHNNAFCDVYLCGKEQTLMELLVNIVKALSKHINKDELTILEVLEYYFFLEKENLMNDNSSFQTTLGEKKTKIFQKLFKQFLTKSNKHKKNKKKELFTPCSLHPLEKDESYIYNKKECILYKKDTKKYKKETL